MNRKLIRKMLFAATLTISNGIGTSASAYQQYQPGEPGKQIPQGNTSVTQELNRMFQESGQPMPSMISQDLRNTNVPTQGQVPPKQSQDQPSTRSLMQSKNQAAVQSAGQSQNRPTQQNMAQTRQANSPAKPGILGKFFGKFRGDTARNNPDYKPPVPPDYNASAPKRATNGHTNQTAAAVNASPASSVAGQVKVPPTTGQMAQSTVGVPQSNRPSASSNQSATAQAYHGHKPPAAQPGNASAVRHGATSEIPPRSGSSVQPVTRHNNTAGATGNLSGYTQPGSAPGFMTAAGSTAVIKKQAAAAPKSAEKFADDFQQENLSVPSVLATVQNQMQNSTADKQVATVKSNDDFDSPFVNGADSHAESEVLDLDSLIDIPEGPSDPEKSGVVETVESTPPVVEESKSAESLEDENSAVSQLAPDENPFTGIQLNSSDAEFFGGIAPAAPVSGDSIPLVPIEDFNADLPAMDLSLDGTQAGGVPSVEMPAVDEIAADLDQPNLTSNSENQPGADVVLPIEADTTGRAELHVSPDVPAAMSEAETEQLRQMAEQERRKQQKRLIQSRAGQTGFKGFCPVALRERRELVEANDQFTSTFGLQTYTFSSAESKAAFDAEPSRYAPAAGGSDVVVLVNSGEEQAGQLDYALWYRDRLYLFRSRETMTLFSKDPLRFASQY